MGMMKRCGRKEMFLTQTCDDVWWHLMRRRKVLVLLSDLTSEEIKYDNSSLWNYWEEENNKRANNYKIIREYKPKYDVHIGRSWKGIKKQTLTVSPEGKTKLSLASHFLEYNWVGPPLGHRRKGRTYASREAQKDYSWTVLKLEHI